jgi:hypothetical protein
VRSRQLLQSFSCETVQENQVGKKPLRPAKAFWDERYRSNILSYEEIFDDMREHPVCDLLVAYPLPQSKP